MRAVTLHAIGVTVYGSGYGYNDNMEKNKALIKNNIQIQKG